MKHINHRGAATEITIGLIFLSVLALLILNLFVNNAGATERRASESAAGWVSKNNVETQRLSCAHDSDGDGYGSCTAVTKTGDKIYLQCVAGFWQGFWGASGCKEVETTLQFHGGTIRR